MDRDSSDGPSEEPTLPPQELDSGNNVKETLETEEPIQDLMEEDGNEDEVVREIDVYISPELDSNTELYILQYPLRPNWRPYELDQRCVEVRVKPKSAKVDIDLSVDINSKNYDTNASDRVKMTKQVLTSSPLGNPSQKNPPIAVGVLVGNKLHVNLVDAVVQLRPSMQHLNPESSRKNSAVSEVEANKPGPSNKLNKDTEEPWVPLKYHGSASEISTRYRQKMVAGPDWSQMLSSMTLLLELPLEERLKTWLVEGSAIHRFNVLKDHLAPTESEENVLRVLGKYAHLIQGLWIPRSDLLYEKDQGTENLVRDYVLLLFSKNLIVSSTQLPESSITELMKEVLNVFAIERPLLGDWKFKECQDVSFMKRHPNIVEENKSYWELREEYITYGVFGGSGKPNSVDRSVSSKNSNNVAPKTSKAPSRAPMPSEIRDALPNVLQKIFRTFKVCSFKHILSRLKEIAISEGMRSKGLQRKELMDAAGGVYFKEELLEIVNKVAIEINGVFVSKSPTDHSQSFELRRIVIDLLKAEPNAKLIEASAIKAAKMRLKRDISSLEFRKVISELCKWEDSAWVLKSGER